MKIAHVGMTGGHIGLRRTLAHVQARAYWAGSTSAVKRFVQSCPECAQYHRGKPPRQGRLQDMSVRGPMDRIAIDITGPHHRSRRGNVYILTMMDHFSKWAEAFAIKHHTVVTVATVLCENVFSRLGMPRQLLSDQGPEFEGHLMKELCRWMDIDKLRTTAYRPATTGMVEIPPDVECNDWKVCVNQSKGLG
jgi:transposase InsO family protein